jgi:Inner membrane component of T3SS, cytoplasmic domain
VLAMKVFVVLGMVTAAALTYRVTRSRGTHTRSRQPRSFRGVVGRVIDWLLDEPTDQSYTPDTRELTRRIIRGMARLGHQSLTAPIRVLNPCVTVTGAAEDIDALRRFESVVLAEIVGYVEQKSAKFRWALNGSPSLSFCVDPDAIPGNLVISPTASGSYQPDAASAWTGFVGAPVPEQQTLIEPPATRRDHGAATNTNTNNPEREPGVPDTRWIGGRMIIGYEANGSARGTDTGIVRLFRIGARNVYHLRVGTNLLGRDQDRCNIVCAFDPAIRAVHLELEVTGAEVTVQDIGRGNGTKVNEQDLRGKATLRHGDVLLVGGTRMRLFVGNAALGSTHEVTPER